MGSTHPCARCDTRSSLHACAHCACCCPGLCLVCSRLQREKLGSSSGWPLLPHELLHNPQSRRLGRELLRLIFQNKQQGSEGGGHLPKVTQRVRGPLAARPVLWLWATSVSAGGHSAAVNTRWGGGKPSRGQLEGSVWVVRALEGAHSRGGRWSVLG